jgi:hypothetical protein
VGGSALQQAHGDATGTRSTPTVRVNSLPCPIREATSLRYVLNRVLLKPQELSYGIEAVFKEHLPKLLHGNDGLIFTSAEAPYTPGTDHKMYIPRFFSPSSYFTH